MREGGRKLRGGGAGVYGGGRGPGPPGPTPFIVFGSRALLTADGLAETMFRGLLTNGIHMPSTAASSIPPSPARARPRRAVRLKSAGLLLLALGALAFLLAVAPRYLGPIDDPHFEPRLGILRVHIVAGALALLLGPLQFLGRLRRWRLDLHRGLGRIYLAGIVVGGVAGLALAPFANGGLPGQTGFAGLSLAWLVTSGMAYAAIRARRIAEHRAWMIRSYVVTLAFVWVRLVLGLGLATGADIQAVFGVAAWASWALPLLVVEVVFGVGRIRARG